MDRLIKIAEGAGDGIEVVSREQYDRIYAEVACVLENKGPAFVRVLKEHARHATTSMVQNVILLTIIEDLPGGAVRLRNADEVDHQRKSCQAT